MAVSSNLNPSGFSEIMDDTNAAPLVNRLLHHAHLIVTEGDSYRLIDALNSKGVSNPPRWPSAGNSVALR